MVVSDVIPVVALIPTLEPVTLVTPVLTPTAVGDVPSVLLPAVPTDWLPLKPVVTVIPDD